MNIVYIIQSLALYGGIERTLIDKANFLAGRGHRVTLVTYEQGTHPVVFSLAGGVAHRDLDCRMFTLYRYGLLRRFLLLQRMKRMFRQRWHGLLSQLNPDVVVTTTYADPLIGVVMSAREKAPVVVESHAAFPYVMKRQSWCKQWQQDWRLRQLLTCDLLIALTEGDACYWRKYASRVQVVCNPLTYYPAATPDDTCRLPGRIICVARLAFQKRYDRLFDAFALIAHKYPDWHIDIFGEGSEAQREQHRQMAAQRNLQDCVSFFAPVGDVYAEYMKSQFLVLSSDYEGFGLILAEAMSCGLPVVSTDCSFGPRDIIDDGVNGLLAKCDARDLADKMEWMITHGQERREMGRNARRNACRFRPQVVGPLWEQAYQSVINNENQ